MRGSWAIALSALAAQRRAQLFVLLWLALVVGAAALGWAAHRAVALPGDLAITRELQEPRSLDALLRPAMAAVSLPGSSPWAEALFGTVALVLALVRRWQDLALLALSTAGDAVGLATKLVVARARPPGDLVRIYESAAGYAFPSGHVVHYTLFFGAVGIVAWRALRGPRRSRMRRFALAAIVAGSAALVASVGASRVYLGAHWPSDVLGGYAVGLAWLTLVLAVWSVVERAPSAGGSNGTRGG